MTGDPTVKALDARIWEFGLTTMSQRIRLYLSRLLEIRRAEVSDLPALGRPWPLQLDPELVPWARRTRNCLGRAGVITDPQRMSRITFGELLAIPQMGASSVLDFAVTSEVAIDRMEGGAEISEELVGLLSEAAKASWAELVSEEDPRFRDLLSSDTGTLADRLEDLRAKPEAIASVDGGLALASSLPGIFERIAQIRQRTLDDALRDYTEALSRERGDRLDALLGRLGLDGRPPRTLQQVAEKLNLSRERVRQIQLRLTESMPSHPVFMPILDHALEVVAESAPSPAEEIAHLLQTRGISNVPFSPESVLAAADFCGRPATFEIEQTPKGARVVTTPMLISAAQITLIASRQSDAFGASNVSELRAALREQSLDVSDEHTREVLHHYSEANFLNADWFWMPNKSPHRNRLYNVSRKILAVASPLDAGTIREGARKSYRFREVPVIPPRNVMIAFYHAHAAFAVDDDGRVSSTVPLDYRHELGKTEQIFVDVLRSSPTGVLDRESLQAACEVRGMNRNTFSVYSTYSPILNHLGTDIWALRGIAVSPAAVEALRQANAMRPRDRMIEDYGWSSEGALWLAVRIPRRHSSLVVGIPSTIAPYVADRHYVARAEDGTPAGTIGVNQDGASWGYGPFLSRRGADEGDTLLVEFQLATGEATLKLGGMQLLEEAQAR